MQRVEYSSDALDNDRLPDNKAREKAMFCLRSGVSTRLQTVYQSGVRRACPRSPQAKGSNAALIPGLDLLLWSNLDFQAILMFTVVFLNLGKQIGMDKEDELKALSVQRS